MEVIAETAVLTGVAPAGGERLLTFVMRGLGGVRIFAPRPRPRRRTPTPFLEPLQGGELLFQRSEGGGGRPRLRSFVPQRVWPGIRADLGRTVHALAFLELFNALLTEGEPQRESFDLLVRFLNRLESENRPGLARIAASLRLLAAAGFAPSLDACTVCRCDIDPRNAAIFSAEAGGVVCSGCRLGRRLGGVRMTPAALGLLQRALSLPEGRMRRLRVAEAVEREASRLLDAFIEARTEERPRWGPAIERLEATG